MVVRVRTDRHAATEGPDTRLVGRTLLWARAGWAVYALALVGGYLLLLPSAYAQFSRICRGARCALVQPTPASAQALQRLGISVQVYGVLTFASILLTAAVCLTIAGVL